MDFSKVFISDFEPAGATTTRQNGLAVDLAALDAWAHAPPLRILGSAARSGICLDAKDTDL